MNTLVLYESQFGNTQKIAELVARELESQGPSRVLPIGRFTPQDLEGADLLVLGGPTQAHAMTPQMRNFVGRIESKPRGVAAAAFDTRVKGPAFLWGSAAREIATKLRFGGFNLLATPESFLVTLSKQPVLQPGEEDHAREWAGTLVASLKSGKKVVAA